MTKQTCTHCCVAMGKTIVKYKGMNFDAWQCPKCKEKIFTEDLAMQAITTLEARKLKEEYVKKTIKIGNSIGMTFPKDVTEAFALEKATLQVHPDLKNNKIEIIIQSF
jgi:ribosomal protein L37AE/L43A